VIVWRAKHTPYRGESERVNPKRLLRALDPILFGPLLLRAFSAPLSFLSRRRGVVPAATAARAKKGSVEAGMYQIQSIEEEAKYAVIAAALPASSARLLVVLVVEKAL
jgi:hypothetical protein